MNAAYEAGVRAGSEWPRTRALAYFTGADLDAYTRGFRAAQVGPPVLASCVLRPAYRIGTVVRNRSRRRIVAVPYPTTRVRAVLFRASH